ncbi:DUF418 domain-containing protein [Sphingomonas naphthae]|uniref:DUF418 domain-containing protein n=1 Tax=Sphingomonas naphthae TaxID=1813468 RepID=A0ABY7TQN9_9SPHN|nr:DUF418 domain-containing protein [Sphingomonas naphthae]WCT74996.1 DUF418 domain-containing protein [Sphingomonas naphthae]
MATIAGNGADAGGLTPEATGVAREPDGAPRIGGLDVLRGIAILGILFMNINDMGGSILASFGDIRHLGWNKADQVAWWLRQVIANGTARCMLEMLFGCGMMILTDRAALAAGKWKVMGRYYLRNLILFLFGLVHVFILLWPGDILHTYGLAALVAFLFRRLKWGWLLAIGLSMAVFQAGGGSYDIYSAQQRIAMQAEYKARQAAGQTLTKDETAKLKKADERTAKRKKRKADEAVKMAAEDKARSAATGDFLSWAKSAIGFFTWMEGKGLEIFFIWEAAGTMLIGAALFKLGIPQGKRSPRFYLGMMAIGYVVGFGLRIADAFAQTRFDDYPYLIFAWSEPARLATTLGHIGAVYVLLATARGAALLKPFAAAGRTALTVYICQTLICLWVLYPPFALGLYGQQGWMALMLTALAVNAMLLWGANIWVRHYDIAPVEWAWRSIVAGRPLPWKKAAA